jgi:hypothetical protein
MKLLSAATLATTLLSYVAADVSEEELRQRSLEGFSSRKSQDFRRELAGCVLVETPASNPFTDDFCVTDWGSSSILCDFDNADVTQLDCGACASAGGKVVKISHDLKFADGFNQKFLNEPYCLDPTCDANAYAQQMENDYNAISPDYVIDYTVVTQTVTCITAKPTSKPTATPTSKPTATPTSKPTFMPTAKPTSMPTAKPTSQPTAQPTSMPTSMPTTAQPTNSGAAIGSTSVISSIVLVSLFAMLW